MNKENCALDISIVFSVQGTGGSPTGSDPENRVGDQYIGSPGRPDLSAPPRICNTAVRQKLQTRQRCETES